MAAPIAKDTISRMIVPVGNGSGGFVTYTCTQRHVTVCDFRRKKLQLPEIRLAGHRKRIPWRFGHECEINPIPTSEIHRIF